MTREEAAQQLTFEKAWMDEHGFISDWIGEAYEMAIAALREVDAMSQELKERRVVMPILAKRERELLAELNKEPDPETGLVPCGCGGIPRLHKDTFLHYYVECPKCDIQIGFWAYGDDHEPRGKFGSKTLAIDMWNTAMGYRPEVEE
jgi:hypothetical protein